MNIKDRIQQDLASNPIKLYMKGTPSFPQCGFSKRVIDILANYDVEFGTSNILEDPELRQGLKDFFDWPTFPMLCVNGELVGGCDIISELHQSGQLAEALQA